MDLRDFLKNNINITILKVSTILINFSQFPLILRILPKKICIVPTDIDILLVHETTLTKDFDGADFNSIPPNELVNIEILVKERWLEENPHLTADSNDEIKKDSVNQSSVKEESLPCGPLENFVMQIKFCDNEG